MVIKEFCRFVVPLLVLTVAPLRALGAEEPTLYLRVGQKYPIEGVLSSDAKLEPEKVATIHKTSEGLLLQARAPGHATLSMTSGGKSIEIHIVVRPMEQDSDDVSRGSWDQSLSELRSFSGVRISKLGGKILVQGEILGRAAYQKVLLNLRNYPTNLIVLALPAPGIKQSLMEQATSLLAGRGLSNVKVSNAGNRFFLEGSVTSPEEVEQAYETAQSVIPNIENHLPLPIRIDPTITVRVFILELSREAHQLLGLAWPIEVRQAAVVTPTSAIFNPTWGVTLQHLSASGQAKILAEPILAVKVGSSAELSAGGEIPIRVTGKWENKVVWKRYGLKIRLAIRGMAGKFLRTKLDAESSQLDEATALDGIPGLRTNKMGTEIDAQVDQPILLTGLFQSSMAKDVDKVPLLGSIPLLGELFKSHRFRERESELLVALLPGFGAPTAKVPLQSAHGLEFDSKWRPLD